ncbi:hypothetical protein GOP47_0011312 [Adiantum capillus-veneris]|uniref:Uncharacterized protein n=1 Tax=Adiantum capillus-veneris TaxID=13818 RepID=A0A9D4ZFA2_ADICA|nr:hypothetical protein GOP47_0011312 [Adiantum capillus-veneris]
MGVGQAEMMKKTGHAVVGTEWCASGEEVLRLWQPACSWVAHVSRLQGAAASHSHDIGIEEPLFSIVNPPCFSFRCHNLLLRHDTLPVLSTTRKCLSLKKVTSVYRGESSNGGGASLLFTVRLAHVLQCSTNLHVFLETPSSNSSPMKATGRVPDYKVKASCFRNDLTIIRNDGAVVATAQHKCSFSSLFLSKPSYKIVVYPGADKAFITILVAIQDNLRRKMHGNAGGGP